MSNLYLFTMILSPFINNFISIKFNYAYGFFHIFRFNSIIIYDFNYRFNINFRFTIRIFNMNMYW